MTSVTLRDLFQFSWPHGQRQYADKAAGTARHALHEVMTKSKIDPTVAKPDDEFTITYTVKIKLSRVTGTLDMQTIEVTATETGISE